MRLDVPEMPRHRLLIIGVALSVMAAILVYAVASKFSDSGTPTIRRTSQPMGYATRELPAGHLLVAADLQSDRGVKDPAGERVYSAGGAAEGRTLVTAVQKGQLIREDDLAARGSGEAIASQLEPGYRAITVTLRDTGPGVALYPGAMVDVLATLEVPIRGTSQKETITRTVLEGSRVLAVNNEAVGTRVTSDRKPDQRRLSVTLAVTPDQAAQVELASTRGVIGITLRSSDESAAGKAGSTPTSANTVMGRQIQPTDGTASSQGESSASRSTQGASNSASGVDATGLEFRLAQFFGVDLKVEDIGGTIALRGSMPNVATAVQVRNFMTSTGLRWVDVTRIAGVQQVQLKVRIAEASRTALRELAAGALIGGNSVFGGVQSPGGTPFQPINIQPRPGAPVGDPQFMYGNNPVTSATTLFAGVTGADLEVYLQALSENRYIRLLAEPNLVAVSGESATFLVGGEFPIPIVQGSVVGGGSTITIEYKEFGIRLNFRPEVLGDGKIRLEVAPEVSELSQIGALNQNGFTIPSLVTRRSSTTVELSSGQSFATAGLLRSLEQATVARIPVLGDMPVFGALFRSVRYEQAQTELVIMVTANLVEPLYDGMDRPMPGDLHEAPNDWELFMNGQTAGAVAIGSPMARLKTLGLEGIRGPGAWRRPDDSRTLAADPLPTAGSAKHSAPAAAPASAVVDTPTATSIPVASAAKSETLTP
jgi:pilus assembly protein CpaC